MSWLFILFFSLKSGAETLGLVDVEYTSPPAAVSCGLLRQRELERLKVIRELEHLTVTAQKGQALGLLEVNNLLTNKLFMPTEDWSDEVVSVLVTVRKAGPGMERSLGQGFDQTFLVVRGPGFIWQSFANQLPPGMSVEDAGEFLKIRYLTYRNVLCLDRLENPTVEWIPTEQVPDYINSQNLFDQWTKAIPRN